MTVHSFRIAEFALFSTTSFQFTHSLWQTHRIGWRPEKIQRLRDRIQRTARDEHNGVPSPAPNLHWLPVGNDAVEHRF